MTFSKEAKKSAGMARSIKALLGQVAYERYKKTGYVDLAALAAARQKKTSKGSGKPKATLPAVPATQAKELPEKRPTASLRMDDAFLQKLRVGDTARTPDGQQLRVQRVNKDGLRIRTTDGKGARDLTWDQLKLMNLGPEKAADPTRRGPAAKGFAELRTEAESMGIETSNLKTIKELTEAMGEAHEGAEGALSQVDPQLASDDAKKLYDFDLDKPWRSPAAMAEYWENDEWIAEEKLDGVRLKLHITESGIRADSRRRDTKTRRFSEKSANFAHLLKTLLPDLEGTVLDSEGMIPAESGTLPSGKQFHGSLSVSTAATNAGPETAAEIQAKFGPMKYWLFDILKYKGKDVTDTSGHERRKLLEDVLAQIHAAVPESKDFFNITSQVEGEAKLPFYERLVEQGGEGIMLKRRDAKYKKGRRSKDWQKVKKFQEIDAYISGFVPGKKGNEGKVGALELSVKIDGREFRVASVSGLTEDQRNEMTAPGGALKLEYYGKVVTFRGQELSKNGAFRHAILVDIRDDKVMEDIDGYELRAEMAALGLLDT